MKSKPPGIGKPTETAKNTNPETPKLTNSSESPMNAGLSIGCDDDGQSVGKPENGDEIALTNSREPTETPLTREQIEALLDRLKGEAEWSRKAKGKDWLKNALIREAQATGDEAMLRLVEHPNYHITASGGMLAPWKRFSGRGPYIDSSSWAEITEGLDLERWRIRPGSVNAAMYGDRKAIDRLCRRVCCLIRERDKATAINSQAVIRGEVLPESDTDTLIAAITEWMEGANAPMSRAYLDMMNAKLKVDKLARVNRVRTARNDAHILGETLRDPNLTKTELAARHGRDLSTISRQVKAGTERLARHNARRIGPPE
jgi:hypothetical protein